MLFFHDMAGVFYAVVFGLVLSLFTLLGELAWAARKDKKHDQVEHLLLISAILYVIGFMKTVLMKIAFLCIK